MTKDDILLALRLVAMGRVGHPLQEEFADKLAELFADRAKRIAWHTEELIVDGPVIVDTVHTYTEAPQVIDDQTKPKRGPGRAKKAD